MENMHNMDITFQNPDAFQKYDLLYKNEEKLIKAIDPSEVNKFNEKQTTPKRFNNFHN